MSNPSKQRGTRAETAFVRFVLSAGLRAQRVALAGAHDVGDVWIEGGRVVVEVKSRKSLPSHAQIEQWRWEMQEEASRVPQCDMGVLVVKRPGSADVGQWWVWVDHAEWQWLERAVDSAASFWMMVDGATFVRFLQRLGWGSE